MAQQSTGGLGVAGVTPIVPDSRAAKANEKLLADIRDNAPSDVQPPGVDEDEPQSLEEALLGE